MIRILGIALIIGCTLLGCKRDNLSFYQGSKTLVMVKDWDTEFLYSYTKQTGLYADGLQMYTPVLLLGGDEADTAVDFSIQFMADDLRPMGYTGTSFRLDSVFRSDNHQGGLDYVIYRDSAFMDTIYMVRLLLETAPEYNGPLATDNGKSYTRELEIRIEDVFDEPYWWVDYEDAFGPFTSRKLREMATWLGFRFAQYDVLYDNMLYLINQDPSGIGIRFRNYLEERAAAGNPVLERDKTPMRAGPAAYL